MLAKSKRLNLTQNFNRISLGKKLDTKLFRLKFIFDTNKDPLIGVALSKKNFQKAYLRNKAKRVVYQAIERIYDRLPKGLNLVIMPKANIYKHPINQLAKELKDALKS